MNNPTPGLPREEIGSSLLHGHDPRAAGQGKREIEHLNVGLTSVGETKLNNAGPGARSLPAKKRCGRSCRGNKNRHSHTRGYLQPLETRFGGWRDLLQV